MLSRPSIARARLAGHLDILSAMRLRRRTVQVVEDRRRYIDSFSIYRNVAFAAGWTDLAPRSTDLKVSLCLEGERYRGFVNMRKRFDLADLFGEGAEDWGFEVVFVLPDHDVASRASAGTIEIAYGDTRILVDETARERLDASMRDHESLVGVFKAAVHASPGARVLEIGSRARSGNTYEGMHAGDEIDYVGMDVLPGPNVDAVGDAHELTKVVQGPFDFAFSISVFEHLLMPWKVAIELNHVLKPGALVFTQTHQSWPVHDEPWDFWRFTRESWAAIFNVRTGYEILQTAYYVPLVMLDSLPRANPLGESFGYGAVSCLARKVGEPTVAWNVPLDEILSTCYPSNTPNADAPSVPLEGES